MSLGPKPKHIEDMTADTAVAEAKEARQWIILEDHEDIPPTGQFVGVNGKGYIIRPGEPVNVPIEVLEVLNNAITSFPQIDPVTRQVTHYKDRMRFAYRIVPEPKKDARK